MTTSQPTITTRCPRHNRWFDAASVIALALYAGAEASAHSFCVDTSAKLQQALTDASDGGAYVNEDNIVTIVFGTYHTGAATGGAPFFFHTTNSTHAMTIYGGFSAACSGERHVASETVLDGQSTTPVMILRSTKGNINVTHLTFANGESDGPGAGLQINYLVGVTAQVNVDHVVIHDNHTSVTAGGLYASGSGPPGMSAVYVSNVLVYENTADVDYGGIYMTGYGNTSNVLNSTITRNHSPAGNTVGGVYCGGSALCNIYDSIAWNNSNVGISLGNAGALVCDDYGTLGGTTPGYSSNNFSVAPAFVDAAGGDFHLAANSPLFALCAGGTGTTDLEDRNFPTSGREDMGAYEDTIFIAGFEE
ncbi:MAG: hypothetical protein ABIQ70_12185 [Dokdonella sp.]